MARVADLPTRLRRGLRSGLVRLASAPLLGLFRLLPWGPAQALGRGLGRGVWHLAGRDRRRALEHLAIAFPELSPERRGALGKDSFRHLGVTLAEVLWLMGRDCRAVDAHLELRGWEVVEAVRAEGRPMVILTGHCGNWELLAAALNCRGLEMAVVARALDDEPLQGRLLALRARFGTRTIERSAPGAARQLLATLRGGGALGMLIDQDIEAGGVWVPFFGRLAHTPAGAARIALRQDARVVPVFVERRPDGSHLGTILPPLELPDDELDATAVMTRTIEEQIRRRPEQWVWMHRRWRRRPPGETDAVDSSIL